MGSSADSCYYVVMRMKMGNKNVVMAVNCNDFCIFVFLLYYKHLIPL